MINQRISPQKLSDANLESIFWNKVPVKLQKEVGQLTERLLQETLQKLLKTEETVKERERRFNQKSSEGREFKTSIENLVQNLNHTVLIVPICQQSNVSNVGKRVTLQGHAVLLNL